jgi:hypothetical protein
MIVLNGAPLSLVLESFAAYQLRHAASGRFCVRGMKKEEARRAVLSEYDSWAKKHPNQAGMMGLSLLLLLTGRKVEPSRFPFGRKQVANRSRLASRSVERLASAHNGKAPAQFMDLC